jgi:hypothetical protein
LGSVTGGMSLIISDIFKLTVVAGLRAAVINSA